MEKIMNLRDILHNLDYNFRINDKVYSNQIQKVLMHFKGKDDIILWENLRIKALISKTSPSSFKDILHSGKSKLIGWGDVFK